MEVLSQTVLQRTHTIYYVYPLYKRGMAQRVRSRRILKTAFAERTFRGIAVIPWDLLIMGQDQLIRGHIAAESEMDAKRWRQQQQQLTGVTDDVYTGITGIRGAFSSTIQIFALKFWVS
ncbi:hypothetical protein ALC62_00331 [Cyphomyrmex costatus]|uniref:Uncharacterized protein n=1 Tax=Cyphomyrmex costatus TaxID=456900 RepID=A0A195D6Z4_9HYME|nr:hypothetical protein ALC62_00331 [Cyphomyrmex costatus]